MLELLSQSPAAFFVWLIALTTAVTIHEFSHAFAADRLGDPTPRINGRLTLNPLAHLDPIGTIALLLVHIGWGKPVPIDPFNLRRPRRDAALISLAGPASNLGLAALLSLLLKLSSPLISQFLNFLIPPIIILNIALAIFNLLPVPPLDGSKILFGLLPRDLAGEWEAILNQYGLFLLLILIFPLFGGQPLVSIIIFPIINFFLGLLL